MKLASLFSAGAVLQRESFIPVWGESSPKSMVCVEIAGKEAFAPASSAGKFILRLPPLPAGGPYELRVTDLTTKEKIIVPDVLVGEVWIASGQSNMEYAMFRADEEAITGKPSQYSEFVKGLKNPETLRMLTVPVCYSSALEEGIQAEWKHAEPENARKFSAVALWFAHEIREKLNVPVGIIASSMGGTCIESWMSRSAYLNNPELRRCILEYDAILADRTAWRDAAEISDDSTVIAEKWAAADFDDSDWKDMRVPGSWVKQGIGKDGAIWARCAVDVPESWAGRDLLLSIGAVDKRDITFFNGTEVGRTGKGFDITDWNTPRKYTVPGKIVKAGRNVIAVHAYSLCFDGAIHGEEKQFFLSLAGAGESIPLTGSWKVCAEFDFGLTTLPSILFNGMINPLIPYAIRGALWYQGEANADYLEDAIAYENRMESLIKDWRSLWGQGDFPFLMVQLAGFGEKKDFMPEHPWPYLRESQRRTAEALPNVGMASALDVGDIKDIHPTDKRTVGHRLALIALHQTYHQENIVPCGPMYRNVAACDGKLRISFDHADGLHAKSGQLKGFRIAGADRRFYPAEAVIDGTSVVLSSDKVLHPYAARYAWSGNPDANLYNGKDLPASPFLAELRND